ncbi:MAG: hypothetical protein ACMG57_04245 [Candidatus Dojkabacteria bacterium]
MNTSRKPWEQLELNDFHSDVYTRVEDFKRVIGEVLRNFVIEGLLFEIETDKEKAKDLMCEALNNTYSIDKTFDNDTQQLWREFDDLVEQMTRNTKDNYMNVTIKLYSTVPGVIRQVMNALRATLARDYPDSLWDQTNISYINGEEGEVSKKQVYVMFVNSNSNPNES